MRQWLVNARMGKNLTQQELADKVGITRQFIGILENELTATPHPNTAKKIAEVLGFDWTKFFEDDKE